VIKTLEKIGDLETIEFLMKRYSRIKWWKSRKPQEEVRSVALAAIEGIQRRREDVG
jgi:hypothetical protein